MNPTKCPNAGRMTGSSSPYPRPDYADSERRSDDNRRVRFMACETKARTLFLPLDPRRPAATGYLHTLVKEDAGRLFLNIWQPGHQGVQRVEYDPLTGRYACTCPCYQEREYCKHGMGAALEYGEKGGEHERD